MRMRKLVCILLAAMLLISFAGCGGNSASKTGSKDKTSTSHRDRDDDDDRYRQIPDGGSGIGTLSDANTAAKDVFNAVTVSFLEMDYEDKPISLLGGKTYYFSGSDFKNITKPESVTTEEETLQYFKYLISVYYADVTRAERIAFVLEDGGRVSASAVQVRKESDPDAGDSDAVLFGAYPNQISKDDMNGAMTLEDALAFAAG